MGRAEAILSAELVARVEGEILKRNFEEGSTVTKDQLLFEIEDSPYVAALSQAKANLQRNQAAKIRAEKDFERGKELRPDGFISASDLDQLESNALQAKAAVEADKAAVENAEINLDYTKIVAPFDGKISKANYTQGNIVNPGSGSLATIIDDDPVYVNFEVNEKAYINFLMENHARDPNELLTLGLRLPNGSMLDQQGVIDYTDTEVNATTGTINIRAKFANPEGLVVPGLYVTVRATAKETRDIPLVPQYAVQENQQGSFVLVVGDDNTVSQRIIETGSREGAFYTVETGLEPGETIVVEGLQKVRIGVAVNPVIKTVDFETGAVMESEQGAATAE